MLNKTKFKSFLKNGMASTRTKLILDRNDCWVSDGAAAYSTKIEGLNNTLNQVKGQYLCEDIKERTTILDIGQLTDVDHSDSKKLILTNYLEESPDYLNRVFMDENNEKRLCQQKYLEILGDFKSYTYTQNSDFSPIFIWDKEELIAFILPVRVSQNNYDVMKFNVADKLARAEEQVKALENELKQLKTDNNIVSMEDLRKAVNLLEDQDDEECLPF